VIFAGAEYQPLSRCE